MVCGCLAALGPTHNTSELARSLTHSLSLSLSLSLSRSIFVGPADSYGEERGGGGGGGGGGG